MYIQIYIHTRMSNFKDAFRAKLQKHRSSAIALKSTKKGVDLSQVISNGKPVAVTRVEAEEEEEEERKGGGDGGGSSLPEGFFDDARKNDDDARMKKNVLDRYDKSKNKSTKKISLAVNEGDEFLRQRAEEEMMRENESLAILAAKDVADALILETVAGFDKIDKLREKAEMFKKSKLESFGKNSAKAKDDNEKSGVVADSESESDDDDDDDDDFAWRRKKRKKK